jgi:hypothetical protein
MIDFTVQEMRELVTAVRAFAWARGGDERDLTMEDLENKLNEAIWKATK